MTPAELDEIADWLVEISYPFDWSTRETPPPKALCKALERAWVRQDAVKAGAHYHDGRPVTLRDRWTDAINMRHCVREEGGWK